MRIDEIEKTFKEIKKRLDQIEFALLNHAICPKCGNYPIKQEITPIKQEITPKKDVLGPPQLPAGAKFTCSKCEYIYWVALKKESNEKKVSVNGAKQK